jgi:hypothetical protein
MSHRTTSSPNLSLSYRLYMHQSAMLQKSGAELNALFEFVDSLNNSEYFTLGVSYEGQTNTELRVITSSLRLRFVWGSSPSSLAEAVAGSEATL